ERSLQAAARTVLRRHANLRAGFRHEGLKQPVQIIPREVELPWEVIDLSGRGKLDGENRNGHFGNWLSEDRARRFDPARPPLLRFALIRLAAEQYRLVLTKHHILMDGWSMPLLVRELLELYERQGDDAMMPRVTPYREYLAWIARQDREAAKVAWLAELAGLEEGTRIAGVEVSRGPVIPQQHWLDLSGELTKG